MRRRSLVLVGAVLVIAGGASVAFAAVSSGPTGPCLNPLATRILNRTRSMAPTIVSGDLVVATGVQPGTPFRRGEVVLFTAPGAGVGDAPFIKRVIGLPGETITLASGRVVISGAPLDEPYLAPGTVTEPPPDRTEWVVASDELFVLGDSRAASADSRVFGAIPTASVSGHAIAICSPDSRRTALP